MSASTRLQPADPAAVDTRDDAARRGAPAPVGRHRGNWQLPLGARLSLGLAVLAYGVFALWTGPAATWEAASRAGLPILAGGLIAAGLGFLLRHLRWVLLLDGLGHRLPWWAGLRIYLAGLALSSTPGKAGETVRSVFLLGHGVPLPHSLAAFFSDRFSDLIGVALLGALAGLAAWLTGVPAAPGAVFLALLGCALAGGSFVLRSALRRPRGRAWAGRRMSTGRLGRLMRGLSSSVAAWVRVWSPARVPWYVLAALGAWGLQALVFAQVAAAVALPLPLHVAVGVFASATLLGAASGVPAGLGVMEAALVLQLVAHGAEPPAALAAALLTRLLTFWFALLLGGLALLSLCSRTHTQPAPGIPS